MNCTPRLESVILEESYVLEILRHDHEVEFVMDLLIDDGHHCVGRIVFHGVKAGEWRNAGGEPTTLGQLNETAHRYHGGTKERADLGTINSMVFDGSSWEIVGDWGEGRLQASPVAEIVIDRVVPTA